MINIDPLTYIASQVIYLEPYKVKMHQPTIAKIAYIGENKFFQSLSFLIKKKEEFVEIFRQYLKTVDSPDVAQLQEQEFKEIEILTVLCILIPEVRAIVELFYSLAFQNYIFKIGEQVGDFFLEDIETGEITTVTNEMFLDIQFICKKVFLLLAVTEEKTGYKPVNKTAERIANKINKAQEKRKKIQQEVEEEPSSFIGHLMSIVSVGLGKTHDELAQSTTIYQLYDHYKRIILEQQHEDTMKAAVAGAEVEVIDWFIKL